MHEAHDINPVFSPDGRWLAFTLQPPRAVRRLRHPRPRRQAEAADLRLRPRHGHRLDARRQERPLRLVRARTAFPAGRSCTPSRSRAGRSGSCRSTRPRTAHFSPDGRRRRLRPRAGHLVSQGLPRVVQRRHLARDADGANNRRADRLRRPGHARRCGARTASKLYYVSEIHGGPANIVCVDLNTATSPPTASGVAAAAHRRTRTTASAGPASAATASGSSTSAAPTCGSSAPATATPRKLAIEVNADDKSNTEQTVTFTRDATEFALSPDENARRLRRPRRTVPAMPARRRQGHPADRHARPSTTALAWSPGRQEAPLRLRPQRHEDIYLLEPDDPDTRS